MTTPSSWPSVAVVIPTRDRPELLRRTLDAVLGQDYPGDITVLVVFDRSDPDESLVRDSPHRAVRVLSNSRTPGLCGSRNTGILAASTELVAFCDDDDLWLPDKLSTQVAALLADGDAEFACTAIAIDYDGHSSVRLAHRSRVEHRDLLASRLAMLHSSTFLARREALLSGIGLLDEAIPGSMCEDWDILLRAARRHPVVVADRPLVRVLWGQTSFFAQRWEMKIAAHQWMLSRHPDIASSRVGVGRVYGQLAFSCAALGRRSEAARWAGRALRARWREPRAYLALAVASGVTTAPRVLARLHEHGHGV